MENQILDEAENRQLSKQEIKSRHKVVEVMTVVLLILFTVLFGVMLKSI